MKRFKRILIWVGIIAAAVVAVALALNALFVRSAGNRLADRLAALRRAGEPVSIPDLAHEPIPPERNADAILRRAVSDVDAIRKPLEEWYPRTGYPTGTLTPAERERLTKLFNDHPGLMPLLEQAAAAPDSDPQLATNQPPSLFITEILDLVGRHRVLYRVLQARSALLLAEGRLDDAAAVQLLALRLARQWRREPSMIGFLVTASVEYAAMTELGRILQAGPVAPATRKAIDAEVALHDTLEGYVWAMRSERAASLAAMRELGPGHWLTRGFIDRALVGVVDVFDRHLRYAELPYARVAAERKSAPRSSGFLNPYGRLAALLEPSLSNNREPAERVRALARSLLVLNALQTRGPAGAGPVPPLAELGLPAETTTDPFTGEPLLVKNTPRGWMVYSVGGNGVDDRGTFDKAVDVGVGPVEPPAATRTP